MFRSKLSKFLFCGALAATTVLAGMPTTAEAGPVRVRFTPPFGDPFPDLEWSGFVDISDGSCTATGTVSNFVAPCAGEFTFLNATLTLSSISTPALTETLNLTGATIISVQRTGLTPAEFQGASSTPFNPVLSTIAPAVYGSGNAYFSLVLAGGTDIQLYWFKNDPGTFFQSPTTYPACGKTGVNIVGSNECGQGSNAAIVTFAPVPEPSTYAMLVAGLLTLGFAARRRTRKA
jgi:hypothetical protein